MVILYKRPPFPVCKNTCEGGVYLFLYLIFYLVLYLFVLHRVVHCFWKRSLNYRFLIVFKTVISFSEKRSFLKTTHSFWIFRKQITTVFIKNDKWPFFIRSFWKTKFSLIIFFLTFMKTIMNVVLHAGKKVWGS